MKKILIGILILMSSYSFAQNFYSGTNKLFTDSNNVITAKLPMRLLGIQTDFGYGSAIFNLRLENDQGVFHIRRNGTDLLTYDDEDQMWDFKYPISLNGVPFTTGGGDVYLAEDNHFTTSNTFDDSIIVGTTKTTILDITDYAKFNCDIITDMQFIKGANTWIKTADNFNLYLGSNNDTAIEVQTDNDVRFHEDVEIDGNADIGGVVTASELVGTNAITTLSGTITGNDIIANGDLTVNDDANITGDLDVTGNITSPTITNKQPLDGDLTTIAGLTATTGNIMMSTSSAWASRTPAQVRAVLLPKSYMVLPQANLTTWADSTIYYMAVTGLAPSSTEGHHRVYVPTDCVITSVTLYVNKGATAGTAQNVTAYIRKNATTDNLITSTWQWTTANGYDAVTVTGLSIAITAGEFFAIKIITPNWATNPTNCVVNATIELTNGN